MIRYPAQMGAVVALLSSGQYQLVLGPLILMGECIGSLILTFAMSGLVFQIAFFDIRMSCNYASNLIWMHTHMVVDMVGAHSPIQGGINSYKYPYHMDICAREEQIWMMGTLFRENIIMTLAEAGE